MVDLESCWSGIVGVVELVIELVVVEPFVELMLMVLVDVDVGFFVFDVEAGDGGEFWMFE